MKEIILDPMLIVGFVGALLIGTAYVLNQLRLWKANDFEYDFINLVGGGILVFYAYRIDSWPIMLLFMVWVVFSLKDSMVDLGRRAVRARKRSK